MQNETPLVSVLMTAYNRGKYIGEAIESVLVSTYTNLELIIVDDCSTDNTVAISRAYEALDKRVKVFLNQKNIKQFNNRNRAASFAKGEFMFYVDSDDTILPDGIALLVQTMNQFPESSFGMYWYKSPLSAATEIDSKTTLHDHFFKSPILVIGPGGTILRRSFFLEINGYTDKYDAAGDMYFNLKAGCYSSLVRIPFEFINYRRHKDQAINTPFEYLYNSYRYLRDALIELPLPLKPAELDWIRKKNNRRFFVNLIEYYFKSGNFKRIRFAIQKAEFRFKDALDGVFH